mmetsp:Transcript_13721/g.20374  ORF Transcript_13721/g.20374 Transcript_13721/m.20374 type:complete len:105 (+) Transcript_13721:139-453(+)
MLWSDDGEEVGRLLCFCGGGGRDASPASVVEEEDAAWWTEEVAGRTIKSAPGAIMVLLCFGVLFSVLLYNSNILWQVVGVEQVVLRANQRAAEDEKARRSWREL